MPDYELVRREHVVQALSEHDRIGAAEFDQRYGVDGDAVFRLRHRRAEYDAPAVARAAARLAGQQAGRSPSDVLEPAVSDAQAGALVLRVLGFDVDGAGLPQLRFANAATVGHEHARATWALAARELLIETATVYRATITSGELADFVQRRSLIRTTQQPRAWMGDVLARVCEECAGRREPFLASLCVDTRGHASTGFLNALQAHRPAVLAAAADVEDLAAEERLECYRFFGATLPSDGGSPERTVRRQAGPRAASRSRTPGPPNGSTSKASASAGARGAGAQVKAPQREPALVTCPVHFTVLPASGVCDLCD